MVGLNEGGTVDIVCLESYDIVLVEAEDRCFRRPQNSWSIRLLQSMGISSVKESSDLADKTGHKKDQKGGYACIRLIGDCQPMLTIGKLFSIHTLLFHNGQRHKDLCIHIPIVAPCRRFRHDLARPKSTGIDLKVRIREQ